jgi:hypothetical protein
MQPNIPAVFPLATASKFNDAFPHQKPGEIEEMLKEPEDSGAETGNGSADDDDEGNSSDDNESRRSRNGSSMPGRSPALPHPPSAPPVSSFSANISSRERRYICD